MPLLGLIDLDVCGLGSLIFAVVCLRRCRLMSPMPKSPNRSLTIILRVLCTGVYRSLLQWLWLIVFPDGQCLYIQWAMYM